MSQRPLYLQPWWKVFALISAVISIVWLRVFLVELRCVGRLDLCQLCLVQWRRFQAHRDDCDDDRQQPGSNHSHRGDEHSSERKAIASGRWRQLWSGGSWWKDEGLEKRKFELNFSIMSIHELEQFFLLYCIVSSVN